MGSRKLVISFLFYVVITFFTFNIIYAQNCSSTDFEDANCPILRTNYIGNVGSCPPGTISYNQCNPIGYEPFHGNLRIPVTFHYHSSIGTLNFDALVFEVNKIFNNSNIPIRIYNYLEIPNSLEFAGVGVNCCSQPNNMHFIDNSDDSTIDVFFVDELEGYGPENTTASCGGPFTDVCGFAQWTFDDFLVLDNSKAFPSQAKILAHEIGHFFGLYHTDIVNSVIGFNAGNNSCLNADGISDTDFNVSSYLMHSSAPSETITPCQRAKMLDVLYTCTKRKNIGIPNIDKPNIFIYDVSTATITSVPNNNSMSNPLSLQGDYLFIADIINSTTYPSNTGNNVTWELFNVTNGNTFISESYINLIQFSTYNYTTDNIYKLKVFERPPYNDTDIGPPKEIFIKIEPSFFSSAPSCDLSLSTFEIVYFDNDGDGIDESLQYYCEGSVGATYTIEHIYSGGSTFYYNNNVGTYTNNTITGVSCNDEIKLTSTNCPAVSQTSNCYYGSASACQDLSTFNHSINGDDVTYNWNWPSGALSVQIEESLDAILVDEVYNQNVLNGSSITIAQQTCQDYYVRAKTFCGTSYSSYTPWTYVDMGGGSANCNSTNCQNPTSVNHSFANGNSEVIITWNNSSQSPHEVCLNENGIETCVNTPFDQNGWTFNINTCDSYSYKVRKICGSNSSGWVNGSSFTLGNNCNLSYLSTIGGTSALNVSYSNNIITIDNIKVFNNGGTPMGPPIEIGAYFSIDNNITLNDILLTNFNSNSTIDPGAFKIFTIATASFHYPNIPDGNYSVGIYVDNYNVLAEDNENNNDKLASSSFDAIVGCSDPTATNYNPTANFDVGRCFYCNDGVQNGSETGVDCGGPDCVPCCYDIYYEDLDGDGYGNPNASTYSCPNAPVGYVTNNGDCNDNDSNVFPFAFEACDGLDNDCDGLIDEDTFDFYQDSDGDGFGNPSISINACTIPSGYVFNNLDCNDSQANVNPLASEICDNFDNNCDGIVDNLQNIIDLTGDIPDNIYHADTQINSDGTINPVSDVIFKAGSLIKLTDGFKANEYFKATIEVCPQ